MSNIIDSSVVEMKFDNAQFERGVRTTLTSLDALNKGLKLDGATKGLTSISSAAKGVSLEHVSTGIQSLVDKFNTLSIVGITALTNIANKAVNAGTTMLKSLTVAPISQGLKEYETQLNSIQTILANTSNKGGNLKTVNAALAELNKYSDQTIYNFAEMARNIGTFTAAGVDLKPATAAIKGIANLAAVSGSSAEQASTAMYQMSQALAAGRVTLMDWNSIVNAGMGGEVFQTSLKETARAHGVAVDAIIKKEGSFRDSLQTGWLSADILTETLSKFTGDLTASQLKQMGYTDKQITGILKMGVTAKDAATKVKTFSQLIGTLQEAAGSGWSQTWQTLFGDFEEARTLFTNVNNVLGGFISASSNARNKVLGDWKALGGRTVLIKAISNAFDALIKVVTPIKEAFRQIFPATTGKQLFELTKAISDFTEKLKIGGGTADKLKRTFAGVFAIFDLGWEVIQLTAKTLANLFGVAASGSGSILDVTARIGDFLVGMHDAIVNGNGLTLFFKNLGSVIATPIKWVKQFIGYLANLGSSFNKVDTGALGNSFGTLIDKLAPMTHLGDLISTAWGKASEVFSSVVKVLTPFAMKVGTAVSSFGTFISSAIQGVNFDQLLSSINTGLFAGLFIIIKKFVDRIKGVELSGGIVDSIKETLGGVTGTLETMQSTLKAATLLQIAAAMGILTFSVIALSKVDAAGLTRALTAMTVMFVQLSAAMFVLQKIAGSGGLLSLPSVTLSLIALGIALNILASAVTKLSSLSWEELTKGLAGVAALMGTLVVAANLMPDGKRMISSSVGLIIMAGAIKILASAVADLSGLSWDELAKGLVGVGTLLGSLALFTRLSQVNKGGIAQGAGIILLALGLKVLASAMKDFASFSWGEIGKGLAVMAGGLTLIGAALYIIPPSSVLSAAAVLVVAVALSKIGDAVKSMATMSWGEIGRGITVLAGALVLIAGALTLIPPTSVLSAAAVFVVAKSLGLLSTALQSMGNMSWESIAKGLIVLAGSLVIIGLAMYGMTGALPGAAALLVVAASLRILAPVLLAFGQMSWGEMAKGLLMLAGVFTVLGVAGLVLTPLVPTLLGLGVAITLLGVGMLAAGAGVLLFSAGLTALSIAGAAGTVALVGIVSALIGLIPMLLQQLAVGLIAFAEVIGTAGPAFTKAITAVLMALITSIGILTPKIIDTLFRMLAQLLTTLANYTPKLVSAGFKILNGILTGIANNIGKIVKSATDIVVNFINALAKSQPRILKAGVDFIISFINGLANTIRTSSAEMGKAGGNLAAAIIEGMARGLTAGVGEIANRAKEVAKTALDSAKKFLGINSPSKEFIKVGQYVVQGFVKGLTGNRTTVEQSFAYLTGILRDSISASNADVAAAEAKLKKLTSARHKDNAAIRAATAALGLAKKEQKASYAAYTELTKNLVDERDKLRVLGDQYDAVTVKLKSANEELVNATKIRDDYNASIKTQYSDLPNATGETKLADYINGLKKQLTDTNVFTEAVGKLKDLGLNDEMYKQLLATGISALPFVQQLVAGGKASVDEINSLDKMLGTAASTLGTSASTALYQAGVDAAAGLVKGLENQQVAIDKQMAKIADSMVAAIKRKLGIKSPSKEFAKIGSYTSEGLARGLEESTKMVERSAINVGTAAIMAMQKTISGMSKLVTADIDLSPQIRPVMDLSDISNKAKLIGGMLETKPLSVTAAYNTATSAARGYETNRIASTDNNQAIAETTPKSFNFTQINNSPKALSASDIYRQTKNQISVVKKKGS